MAELLEDLVKKYALQNAVFYEGKADSNAVLGKIMAEKPSLRKKAKEVKKQVQKTVKEINSLSLEEQKKRLEKLAPELLEKETKEQGLPELEGAEEGKVVTRFAPAPTGPLHISHILRAAFLSYIYARRYKGKMVLRLEDTDPRKVEKKYYRMIQEDLKSVGINWDELARESDSMPFYYQKLEDLLNRGKVYICKCPAEKFRQLKKQKKNCPCRKTGNNKKEWKKMLNGKYKEGEAVARLKTGMERKNPALRDPVLFRIIDHPHPRKGSKYRVWPVYNYACALEDHKLGVTHVFRAKEHEHNTAVQKIIYDIFDWKFPIVINFGMVYLPGLKTHTRVIKKKIQEGEYSGWDDLRLPTVRAFLRRGFHPEALEELARNCGLTKTDIELSWENLEGINRKVIDPIANRYMAVLDPIKISVQEAPEKKKVQMKKHPNFPERGKKIISADPNNIYIQKSDYKQLKGKEFRLIGLGNIKLEGKIGTYTGEQIIPEMQKIQWVSEPNVQVKLLRSGKTETGLGEPEMNKLKVGDIVQLNRIGFGRVDKKTKKEITVAFAHR